MDCSHLANKVVSKEDVGRSSQHGVRRNILHLGFEEAVRRVTRNSHVAELWFEVYDGHCHLKVEWEEVGREEREEEEGERRRWGGRRREEGKKKGIWE